MEKSELDNLLKELETIHSHVVIFKESYSIILKRAPKATKAHLLVFQQVFPYLENVLNFMRSILPTVNKMEEFLPSTSGKLPEAAQNLGKVTEATEMATTEIMDLVEKVMNNLKEISDMKGSSKVVKTTISECNDDLFSILNALQFQDITSQQIESIKAIIASVNNDLIRLVSEFRTLKVAPIIDVKEGTYDNKAVFDREIAGEKQKKVDEMFNSKSGTTEEQKKEEREPPAESEKIDIQEEEPEQSENSSPDNEKNNEEQFSQDDIDSLFK